MTNNPAVMSSATHTVSTRPPKCPDRCATGLRMTCNPAVMCSAADIHSCHFVCKLGTQARSCSAQGGRLPGRQVANIVHGFAAMGHNPGNALLAACASQAAERVAEAVPQNLANTLWGFATLDFNPGHALLRACEAAAMRRAEGFAP